MRCLLAIAAVIGLCLSAQAQAPSPNWREKPYDPVIGSRWSIVSIADTVDKQTDGQYRTMRIESRAEMKVEEKLADGFRITFVTRDIKVTGNAPGVDIIDTAFGATKDIVIRARTDKSGMPIFVENITETRAAMRVVVDSLTKHFEKNPRVGAVLRQLLESFFLAEGPQAAKLYMEELVALSAGQSTGLTVGQDKRVADDVPSPMGGGTLKSTLSFRLDSADDKTGDARIRRTRIMDPESLKTATLAIVRQLAKAASDKITPEMIELMKIIEFNVAQTTLIDVSGGIARKVDDRSTSSTSIQGRSARKTEIKTITVTEMR